jgi:hypothetical protein
MFNGEFIHMTAGTIKRNEVILGGARTVTAVAETADGKITVTTIGAGPETYDADAAVYVFRPDPACADEPCDDCGAAPGEPCRVDCLGCAALDDAAETYLP